MKILKPMGLSLLTGPYERRGKCYLAVVAAAMTGFGAPVLEHEQTLWKILGATPGFTGGLDELRPKVKPEVLALGWAFAPAAASGESLTVTARSVRIQVGDFDKELWVAGDRRWKDGVPTDPEPFDRMPITWDRAFGGEGYSPNPVGRGHAPVTTEDGPVHLLPNVEVPRKLVTSPRDRPAPAGFGPLDLTFPSRIARAGTYDKKWLETRFPDMPDDFDPTYYNVAPEDQWLEALSGGERVVVERMHPTRERLEAEVPSLVARCYLSREGDPLRELSLRLDTLWLVPHVERMVLVYRGFAEVKDDEASDVLDILVALERAGDPRPRSHYAAVRDKRLDRDKGALHMLRDRDLCPEGFTPAAAAGDTDLEPLLKTEGLAERALRRLSQTSIERTRDELRAMGVDPDAFPLALPPPAVVPDLDETAELLESAEEEAREAIADAEVRKEAIFAELRQACAENGLDFDKLLDDARREAGGPPKFSAVAEMDRLMEMAQLSANTGIPIPEVARLADPELRDKLVQTEQAGKDVYRKYAHHLPRAHEAPAETSARVRGEVLAWLAQEPREPLGERDLTGADLSGIDFSGHDLSRGFLEAARLDGCNFSGANLEEAVLARASLRGAVFTGARLRGANFGEAVLEGAKLGGGVDATESVFVGADLSGADLRGIKLDKADITGSKLAGADLTGAVAVEITVLRSDFRGAIFRDVKLDKSNLLELDLSGVDLRGVSLVETVLLDVVADGACFDGAELRNLRVVGVDHPCSLAGASFRGANLTGAFLRGARLQGADLRDAVLDRANLSKCALNGARLDGARAVEVNLIKADLTDASLEGTDLMDALLGGSLVGGARFERANLFRADALGAVGDGRTSFRGANVNNVRRGARGQG